MSEAEIKAIVNKLADMARVLSDADPDDKSLRASIPRAARQVGPRGGSPIMTVEAA